MEQWLSETETVKIQDHPSNHGPRVYQEMKAQHRAEAQWEINVAQIKLCGLGLAPQCPTSITSKVKHKLWAPLICGQLST